MAVLPVGGRRPWVAQLTSSGHGVQVHGIGTIASPAAFGYQSGPNASFGRVTARATVGEEVTGAAPVVGVFADVRAHVPVALAERALARAAELDADLIVSVGGGSTTGLAKAVALPSGLPVLAVPTTYAGSEATPVWGLTEQQRKTDRHRRPGAALRRGLRPGADARPARHGHRH